MPTRMCEAARDCENEVFAPCPRGDAETSGTVTESIRDVCEAIRLVKTNVERFVSRATEILL